MKTKRGQRKLQTTAETRRMRFPRAPSRILVGLLVAGVLVAAGAAYMTWSQRSEDGAIAVREPSGPVRRGAYEPPASVEALKAEELATAEDLVRMYPRDPRALGLLGNVWSSHGMQSEAKRYWEEALRLDPKDAHGYDALATLAFLLEEHERAVSLWRKAAELDPSLPGVRHHLGQALLLAGRSEEALAAFRSDVERNPGAYGSWYFLGQIHHQRGEYDAARGCYERAIRLKFDHVKAHYGLFTALSRLGRKEEAAAALERFRELKALDVREDKDLRGSYDDLETLRASAAATYVAAGELLIDREERGQAEELWLRATRLDPRNTASRAYLARLYQASGREEEAIGPSEELCDLEPANGLHRLNLGILLARRGRFSAAEECFRKVCVLAPERSDGYRLLAQIRLDQGKDMEGALALALKAVKLELSGPNLFVLGALLTKTGNMDGARRSLERAIDLEPGNPQYRQAYERIRKSP